jgi:shikimate dehydrogenase
MHGQENISPWPQSTPFPAGAFVYDLIYNPRETALLRQARAAGCGVANGLGMLLRQGALAFKIWTGVRPDIAVMERAVNSASASGP